MNDGNNYTVDDDVVDNEIEIIEKVPKQKREYVMTEKRKIAFERMKEGRIRKAIEANEKKNADKQILEAVKSVKKIAKKKPIIMYESSDEEPEIIMKPSRRPSRRLPASPLTLPEPEPVPFRLRRM
jgi:hypothetical protein